MAVKSSLDQLLEVGAHFGHQMRRWNPKMEQFMYTNKDGVYIFDLLKTKKFLDEALAELESQAKAGKQILFLGTKKQAKDKVVEIARDCDCFYVNERWLGGTFTNFDQMRKSVAAIADTEDKLKRARELGYTKKERLLLQRELDKLYRKFGGIVDMEILPDLLFVVDASRQKAAIAEAVAKNIPVVAIADSNADPDTLDWIIPMNDDATRSVSYVLDLVAEAVKAGKSGKSIKKVVETKEEKKEVNKTVKKVKKDAKK